MSLVMYYMYDMHVLCSLGFAFRVQVSDDGMKSLVRLANGDMRKALNILQVSGKFFF